MTRIQCIQAVRDTTAMSALIAARDAVREDFAKWGEAMPAEERAFTKRMLGNLIAWTIDADAAAVRMGETMNRRLMAEAQAETHDMHKEAA